MESKRGRGISRIGKRVHIVTTFIGIFALADDNKILAYNPFEKDARKIAESVKASEHTITMEEKEMMNRFRGSDFIFPVRKKDVRHWDKAKEDYLKQSLREIAIEKGFVKDQIEFNQLISAVSIALAKAEIRKAVERDSLIIQANGILEELDKSINIMTERLREFYSLHFPEMDRIISNHEKYAKLVEQFGTRENIDDPELKQFTTRSMGIELGEADVKALQSLAAEISRLYELRKNMEDYLDGLLKEIAPNLRVVAGPQIAAKLIAKAGGLDKLARMPSSTLQLIGAEKALFRHLHGRGKSPKHGLISAHPILQNASQEIKGKIARLLASKFSIAAKIDKYSKKDQSEELKKDLQEKIKKAIQHR